MLLRLSDLGRRVLRFSRGACAWLVSASVAPGGGVSAFWALGIVGVARVHCLRVKSKILALIVCPFPSEDFLAVGSFGSVCLGSAHHLFSGLTVK